MKINLPKEVFEFILKEVNHLIESGDAKALAFRSMNNYNLSFSNTKTMYNISVDLTTLKPILCFYVKQGKLQVRFRFDLSWIDQIIRKFLIGNHKEVEVTITSNEDKVFGRLSTTVNYHFTEEQFSILSPKLHQLAKTIKEGALVNEKERLESAMREQVEKIKEILDD